MIVWKSILIGSQTMHIRTDWIYGKFSAYSDIMIRNMEKFIVYFPCPCIQNKIGWKPRARQYLNTTRYWNWWTRSIWCCATTIMLIAPNRLTAIGYFDTSNFMAPKPILPRREKFRSTIWISIQVDPPQILAFYLLSTVASRSIEQTLIDGHRRNQHLFPSGDFAR